MEYTERRRVIFAMFAPGEKKSLKENIKALAPAWAVLLATLVISTWVMEFAFSSGWEAIWKTFFRFLRLSALLALPLFLLPRMCSFLEGFFNRGKRQLIQVREERDLSIHPLKNWILRPFQGIGLSMLISAKLLSFLEIYTGNRVTSDTVLPPGHFNFERFLGATAIAIIVSLLLSFLWALDDLGVRYYNRKTQEIRMIGKYIGVFLPIFFGFYGIISLFEDHSRLLAARYIFQMAVVLYPPFVVFNVLHARYLARQEEILLGRLKAERGTILMDGE
jgi:hypothetical protein